MLMSTLSCDANNPADLNNLLLQMKSAQWAIHYASRVSQNAVAKVPFLCPTNSVKALQAIYYTYCIVQRNSVLSDTMGYNHKAV